MNNNKLESKLLASLEQKEEAPTIIRDHIFDCENTVEFMSTSKLQQALMSKDMVLASAAKFEMTLRMYLKQ